MNHSEADIVLVEKYFDAELNDAELKSFTRRIEGDENFKQLVEQEKALIAAIRFEGAAGNLQYLEELETKLQKETPIHLNSGSNKWYYYAAAALGGAIIMVAVFMNTLKEDPEQLFQAYFTPYPNMFEATVRSNESTTSNRTDAFRAYEQGDYQKAAMLFSGLLNEKTEPGILLLLGNSNLMLGNLEDAKKNFNMLEKDFDELDIQSKWYLSLCYLKGAETENARILLKELADSKSSYSTKAKELLGKIN